MIDRERLQEMLNIAPFHRWLGLEIATCSDQGIAITMPWREEIVSNPMIGSAHGGILASLVDLTGLYTLLAGGVAARATAAGPGRNSSRCATPNHTLHGQCQI